MSKRAILWGSSAVLVAAAGYFGALYVYENRLYSPIASMVSPELRERIKKTVFVFQYADELEGEIAERDRRLAQMDDVRDLLEEAVRTDPGLPAYLPFARVGTETFEAGPDRFELTSYETPWPAPASRCSLPRSLRGPSGQGRADRESDPVPISRGIYRPVRPVPRGGRPH